MGIPFPEEEEEEERRGLLLLPDLGGGASVWALIHVPAVVEAPPSGLCHLQEEGLGSGA